MEYTFNKDSLTTIDVDYFNGSNVDKRQFTGTLRECVKKLYDSVGLNRSAEVLTIDIRSNETGELLLSLYLDDATEDFEVYLIPRPDLSIIVREIRRGFEEAEQSGSLRVYEDFTNADTVRALCAAVEQYSRKFLPADYVG